MPPRRPRSRVGALLATGAVLAAFLGSATASAVPAGRDSHRGRGLFVDPTMSAHTQGGPDYRSIARRPQALWVTPEAYPTAQVRDAVDRYASRAVAAGRTPVLTVYGIPDRDCGQHSSGGLPGARGYTSWVRGVARGVAGRHALVVLEPDAVPYYGDPRCQNAADRLVLLRFASRVLSRTGAWVYLDAGHSAWAPYDDRAALLKRAGIGYDRGLSTNVANFRPTGDERRYAERLLDGLRDLGVTGKHYVVDTSRNGDPHPVEGDVLNPVWARLGAAPRLVLDGAFDGRLWVKHPGESDGPVNGGGAAGQWCDALADRLLDRPSSGTC